jgi:hypothetical protein
MKKAPENRGLGVQNILPPSWRRALLLLFGFCLSSFLGGLLGCALHRLILHNIKILRFENRNVIHI